MNRERTRNPSRIDASRTGTAGRTRREYRPVARRCCPLRNRKYGLTTTEVLVSIAVLGAAVTGVGKFASTMQQGLRDRELSARIGWEVLNAREEIGSWNFAEITAERIEAMPVSDVLHRDILDARWEAQVEIIEQPVAATQVTLALAGNYRGQAARPQRLTFWVARSVPGGANDESTSAEGEQHD